MKVTRHLLAAALVAAMAAGCAGESTGQSSEKGISSEILAAASERVAAAKANPDGVGIEAPLSKAPEESKTVAFLKCPVATCATIGLGVAAATDALGWNFELVDFGATPEEQNAAFEKALQLKPDVIIQSSGSIETLAPSLQKTKEAGVPVVEAGTSDEATGMDGNGIVAVLNSGKQLTNNASMVVDWIVSDADGSAPEVAVFTIPAITVLKSFGEGIESAMGELCSDCDVSTINAQVGDIGKLLPQTVVSHVQQNPGVKYVAFAFGGMSTGVSAALREAGMTDVRIVGETPSEPNLANLGEGTESAWVGQDSTILGWRLVDAYVRFSIGDDVSVAQDALLNNQLLVAGEYEPTGRDYEGFAGYEDAFKQLWKVSD